MKGKLIIIGVLLVIVAALTYGVTNKERVEAPNSFNENTIHNIPVFPAVKMAWDQALVDLAVSEDEAVLKTAIEREWSDSCLGLGGPAESCLQVITPGYEVVVEAQGESLTYRTNTDGSVIRKDEQL